MARLARRTVWSVWIMAIFGVTAAAVLLFHSLWLGWMGAYLVVTEPPEHADMVVVLGGDLHGNRILTAAELARKGFAPTVLVSGSGPLYGQHESDLAVAYAVAHGYDEGLFVKLRYPALSTRDETEAVVKELRKRKAHRILLVTSNFHTRRAGEIFHAVAPEMEARVIASPDEYFSANGWWKTREGQKTFVNEWTKTLAYWLGD